MASPPSFGTIARSRVRIRRFRRTMHRIWLRVIAADSRMHSAISLRFPRVLSFADRASEIVFNLVSHNAFSVIAGLVGCVLFITGVIDRGVVVAMAAAWLTAILWVARSKPVLALTIPSRLLVMLLSAAIFACLGWGFGRWALNKYHEDQRAAKLEVSPQPAAAAVPGSLHDILQKGGLISSTTRSIPTPQAADNPAPELILEAPSGDRFGFSWVPSVDLTPRLLLAGKPDAPKFQLRNLSKSPIAAVQMDWSLTGESAEQRFLKNARFSRFGPHKSGDMLAFTNGPSFLVSDHIETQIAFVGSDPIQVIIPGEIWNGFQLKLIATSERIDPRSERAHGLTHPSEQIVANLRIRFRQQKTYERRYAIETSVRVVPDNAYYAGVNPPSLQPKDWSADNLRADLAFSVKELPDMAPEKEKTTTHADRPTGKEDKTPPIPEKHLTLRDLFLSDLGTLKMHSDLNLDSNDGKRVTIISQAYFDYNGKSSFVGFFIPSDAAEYVYEICVYLAGVDHASALKHTGTKTSGGLVGQMTSQDDLVFTGRVYIYHEPDLSIEQRAELVRMFRSKNLDVQFRGNDYLMMQDLARSKENK